jgi:hypothetical protein
VSVKGICRLNFGKRGDLGGGILVERLSWPESEGSLRSQCLPLPL